jgi:GT2 family glycosyltransferase
MLDAHSAKTPPLSIIVVSYNTREMTLACLRSVFEQTTRTPFELIVVDNQSEDGSADAIEAEFGGRIRLIRAGTNLGFAAANNLAAEEARGEYLLLLNPDTVVLDGAIDKLVGFARERPEAKIWGGRTVFEDGSLNPASCWGRPSLWSHLCQAIGAASALRDSRLFNPEGLGGWRRDSVRRVDIVSGCFLLIERALWDELGGFDPVFFMYGEDSDLCLRAARAGAGPLICPEAQIVHLGGKSERIRAEKIIRLYRAKVQLSNRHLPRWQRGLARFLQRVNVVRRRLLWSVLPRVRPALRHSGDADAVFAEVWKRRREWLDSRRT